MINRVVLVGRMTKEADLKYTSTGKAVTSFTLAVNKVGKKDEANFINCVAWEKKAESTANFTKKGSLVGVEGRIETRSYDGQDGKRVYVTEIVCDSVTFLDSKEKSEVKVVKVDKVFKPTINDDPFGGSSKIIDIDSSDLPF